MSPYGFLRSCAVLVTLGLICAQFVIHTAEGQDSFYDTRIESLGNLERLYCSNITASNIYPNYSEPLAWMLPNLTVIYGNSSDGKYTFEDLAWTLAINLVNPGDLGLYHCMMYTENDQWFLVKLGLNARGPYYVDLWDTYELNTIIGLSAAGGFMLLVAALYLLCRFKPKWFERCGGGAVDPYDDAESQEINENGDVEKSMGTDGQSSEDVENKSLNKVNVESDPNQSDDGKVNLAFNAEEKALQ